MPLEFDRCHERLHFPAIPVNIQYAPAPPFFEACNQFKSFANQLVPESSSNQRMHPNYRKRFLEDQKSQGESKAMEKFQSREWKAGDIYAPHDLSPAEMKKWSKRKAPSFDAFDALNLNPLDLHKVRILDIKIQH
jgi:hypothetical protein